MKPTTPPPSPASPPSKKPRPQHCTQGVLSCRHWGRVPLYMKIWPPGCHFNEVQGHSQSCQTTKRRRRDQHRSTSLLYLPQRQQALDSHQGTNFKALRCSLIRIYRTALQERHQTTQHSVLVRHPGEILQWHLSGWWRTTTSSSGAAKLPWHDLLWVGQTYGTRTWVRTPNRLGWGHPLGFWVRTPAWLLSEDTLSTPVWGHLLSSWVRTPSRFLGEDTHLAVFPTSDRPTCG